MKQSAGSHVKTPYRIVRDTLVIDLGSVHRVPSSAPRSGGLVKARSIPNHRVAANPVLRQPEPHGKPTVRAKWSDPARYLGTLAAYLDAVLPCVGLLTAVPMTQLVAIREEANGIWAECFCTVGMTNAVKAGEPAFFAGSGQRCCASGTINIILITSVVTVERTSMHYPRWGCQPPGPDTIDRPAHFPQGTEKKPANPGQPVSAVHDRQCNDCQP